MSAAFMKPWSRRPLTAAERAALSDGLAAALEAAGIEPLIVARPSIPAVIVSLWRRRLPVMVLGRRIFWPGALEDFSGDPVRMSVLQHELQHVLEFGLRELSRLSYVLRPRNWVYGYEVSPTSRWSDFGAEQRAMIVQHYWLAQNGRLKDAPPLESFRDLIPWAR